MVLIVPCALAQRVPVLVCFGDSLTAGYGAEPGHSYPDYLQKDLDAQGYRYHVINKGVSGDTTKDGLERLRDVLALHPQIVVVEFGGNDGLRGIPITQTRQNLDAMLASLTRARIQVLIAGITLPPNYGPDYIRDFDQTYVLLARKYKLPLLPFLLQHVYNVPGDMQEDGIHATARGNKCVAKDVLAALKPLIRKQPPALQGTRQR